MLKSEIIAQMPKIELHCHLDGSLSLKCIKALAKNDQVWIPLKDDEILQRAQAPETTKTLLEYLERFDFVLPLLQTYQNLELAAYDVAEQVSFDNIKYIEIRFAPMQHLQENLTLEEAVEAVLAGCVRAEQDFDLKINLLICGLKQEKLSKLEKLLPIFDRVTDEHLVGFDLAGDELNFPTQTFASLLTKVQQQGISMTLHAGECPHCATNMKDSVALGAKRLGHGVCARDFSKAELEKLIADQTVLEMAPTSNFQTNAIQKLEEYPFKMLYDVGVHVTINTDNRTVSNTTLQKEYEKIASWYDFTVADFEQINHYAIDGAFVSADEKEKLYQILQTAYENIKA